MVILCSMLSRQCKRDDWVSVGVVAKVDAVFSSEGCLGKILVVHGHPCVSANDINRVMPCDHCIDLGRLVAVVCDVFREDHNAIALLQYQFSILCII